MQKGAHTQYDLQFHVVWITKYRKKILVGKIASRLKVLLMQGCSAKGITIIKGNIQPEHVHLLISIPPSLSIAPSYAVFKRKKFKKIARRIFVVEEAILGSTYVGDWVFL